MTDLRTALTQITDSINTTLTSLVTSGDIEEVIIGSKKRGNLKYPHIKFIFDIAKCNNTTIGSIGNNEAWTLPVKIGATVKEIESPEDGMIEAAGLVSDARNLLLSDRQLGIPSVVRKVDSDSIEIVPFPFGKKKTLYGAGTVLNVVFIINNE
jgi:hypothetical protein